ncbi:calcium-binding protein CML42-like [Phalaenopsis equestris]|uniref:calcium-binding protein CML42-like n=1 Tax=Phalaenopsis equestris TaxID=78828 RepID=UPI0009E27019|nr:calcium-binding protein CML42-like [Phalaenopsis equestris]
MAESSLKSTPSLFRASPSFRLRSSSLTSARLRRIFDIFDRNGDDIITADELCEALDRLGLGADPSELRPLVASFLHPGQSGLNFDAFHSFHQALGDAIFGDSDGADAAEEADMREAFTVFDEDGDGYISAIELQAVLGKLGLVEGRSIDRVYEMIGSVDRNRDGRVDYFEFKNMMKSVPVQSS